MNDNAKPNGVPASLPDATAKDQAQWREYCSVLQEDNARLRSEIQMLRDQRRNLLDTFIPARHKHYDIDEEILARMETKPTILEILAEHAEESGKVANGR